MRSDRERSTAEPVERGAGDVPALRVVRGDATAGEIAALVAVLAARARQSRVAAAARVGAQTATTTSSVWSDRSRSLPAPAFLRLGRPGPDAWRRSALPGG